MKFRFETILKMRKSRENLAKKDLALVNAHLLKQQDRLQFLEETEEKSKRELDARSRREIDVNQMVLYDQFFGGVRAQEKFQTKIIAEVSVQLEKKRALLAEAMRRRRTMEILKERETQAYEKLQMKRETELLDEAGTAQWRMKSL
ncbi:MAG: flagellar export protein FliJ [Nitrospinae bacterium]|nr:flagellar export protein FliJ [Nitrospinota bacterium]